MPALSWFDVTKKSQPDVNLVLSSAQIAYSASINTPPPHASIEMHHQKNLGPL